MPLTGCQRHVRFSVGRVDAAAPAYVRAWGISPIFREDATGQ